jgi:ribosomal 50S subunit-recycling heat shock protein
MTDDRQPVSAVRLDVWLDVACLFRTRSEAQKACKSGKVEVNGETAKSNRLVRAGDKLEMRRPFGRTQNLVVRAVAQHHVTKAEAFVTRDPRGLHPPARARQAGATSPAGPEGTAEVGGRPAMRPDGKGKAARRAYRASSSARSARARSSLPLWALCSSRRATTTAATKMTTIRPSDSHVGIWKTTYPAA